MDHSNVIRIKISLILVLLICWSLEFIRAFDVQENYEFLSRCIKEDLGFKDGKPLAASIIYRCLLQWHAFESERTAIFDYIIEGINDVLKVINWIFSPPSFI